MNEREQKGERKSEKRIKWINERQRQRKRELDMYKSEEKRDRVKSRERCMSAEETEIYRQKRIRHIHMSEEEKDEYV